MWVPSLSWEDPLEEGMATDSSILAWDPGNLKDPGKFTVHRVAKSQRLLSQLSMHAYYVRGIRALDKYLLNIISLLVTGL